MLNKFVASNLNTLWVYHDKRYHKDVLVRSVYKRSNLLNNLNVQLWNEDNSQTKIYLHISAMLMFQFHGHSNLLSDKYLLKGINVVVIRT